VHGARIKRAIYFDALEPNSTIPEHLIPDHVQSTFQLGVLSCMFLYLQLSLAVYPNYFQNFEYEALS
jgi:hypothetical protein